MVCVGLQVNRLATVYCKVGWLDHMEKYGGDFCQIKTLDFSIFTHFYLIGMLRVQQSAFYETKINVFRNYVMFGF